MYLWVSQILSQLTVNMMNFLLLTRLFSVTGSTIATSFLWVAYALPAIFVGPIGAATVDFVSKRNTLMWTNLLQALTVFTLIFTHQQSLFLLYAIVVLYSLFNQFYLPAESASLPSVVEKKNLAQANSLFFVTQQSALVVGFGLAGIVESLLGFSGSLIACSVFLFIAFLATAFLPEMKSKLKVPEKFDQLIITFFKSIYEGYEFIKSKKGILFPLIFLLGFQIILAMIVVNLPVIATQILNVPVSLAGLLVVVPAGLGAIIGSIFVSKKIKKGTRKSVIIEHGMAELGLSLLSLVFVVPYFPIFFRVVAEMIFVFVAGLGFTGTNIPTITYLQEATPEWLRGRVFGNLGFLITIATIFPVIFSGVITDFFGVRSLLTLMGAGVLLVLFLMKKKGNNLIKENFAVINK